LVRTSSAYCELPVFPRFFFPPVSTNPGPSVYVTPADTVTVAAVAVAAAVYPVTFYSILPQD